MDISRVMLKKKDYVTGKKKENDDSKEIKEDSTGIIYTYTANLAPFLKYLWKLDMLNIEGDFEVSTLKEESYSFFSKQMEELANDFGTNNIMKWIPKKLKTKIDNENSYDIYDTKWYKEEDAVLFMFRLREILFEVAKREKPEIENKSYYDRLRIMAKRYSHIQSCIKDEKKSYVQKCPLMRWLNIKCLGMKCPLKRRPLNIYASKCPKYIREIERKLEKGREEGNKIRHYIRNKNLESDESDSLKISALLRERNKRLKIRSTYPKDEFQLGTEKEDEDGIIDLDRKILFYMSKHSPNSIKIDCQKELDKKYRFTINRDYFNQYLKLTLKMQTNQFPEDLWEEYNLSTYNERVIAECKKNYEKNPSQNIEDMIKKVKKKVAEKERKEQEYFL